MNTKALLATLIVAGSSTAALADPYEAPSGQPIATVTGTVNAGPGYTVDAHRDHDGDRDRDRDRDDMRPRWTLLSSNDQLARGRAIVRVGSWKKFSTLELQATRGESDIDKVMIRFSNGRSEVVELHQDLGGDDSPSLTVDLDGAKRIASITVLGHAKSRRAAFEILGV